MTCKPRVTAAVFQSVSCQFICDLQAACHSSKSLLLCCKQFITMFLLLILQLANKPSAIAIEPTVGHKAAVLTLLVQLPFGDSEFAPSGQSGMAVGSALVCIGECMRTEVCFLFGDSKIALGLAVELKHCKK